MITWRKQTCDRSRAACLATGTPTHRVTDLICPSPLKQPHPNLGVGLEGCPYAKKYIKKWFGCCCIRTTFHFFFSFRSVSCSSLETAVNRWVFFFAHSNDIGYLLRRLNPSLRSCTWMEERYARLSSLLGISLPVICS